MNTEQLIARGIDGSTEVLTAALAALYERMNAEDAAPPGLRSPDFAIAPEDRDFLRQVGAAASHGMRLSEQQQRIARLKVKRHWKALVACSETPAPPPAMKVLAEPEVNGQDWGSW